MSTLLLRLQGPMQSWGTDSRFSRRFTDLVPSKSGVVGLLGAALGKPRDEQIGDGFPTVAELAALRMGVRVEREGTLQRDYHTVGGQHGRDDKDRPKYGVARASGGVGETVVSIRYYLADADFLVGLGSDDLELLLRLDAALRAPVWPLFLGRKSFVPASPIALPTLPPEGPSIRATNLERSLTDYPWRPVYPRPASPARLRLIVDATPGQADGVTEVRQDWPVSFGERRFANRPTKTSFIPIPPKLEVPDVSLPA